MKFDQLKRAILSHIEKLKHVQGPNSQEFVGENVVVVLKKQGGKDAGKIAGT